jgi:hypothetical protein
MSPYVATHARGDGCLLGRRRFRILVFNVTVHGSCFDLETFARPGLQQRPLHVFPSQRRRRSVFGFQEHRLFQKIVRSFSPAMTLARPLRRLRSHDLLPRTVFSCLDLRAASSTICRADSCEPTRPIATDSAPHFRTSEARSSSSGARSEVEFITTQRGVKHFSRIEEKNFKKIFAVTQPNRRAHKMLCARAWISPLVQPKRTSLSTHGDVRRQVRTAHVQACLGESTAPNTRTSASVCSETRSRRRRGTGPRRGCLRDHVVTFSTCARARCLIPSAT